LISTEPLADHIQCQRKTDRPPEGRGPALAEIARSGGGERGGFSGSPPTPGLLRNSPGRGRRLIAPSGSTVHQTECACRRRVTAGGKACTITGSVCCWCQLPAAPADRALLRHSARTPCPARPPSGLSTNLLVFGAKPAQPLHVALTSEGAISSLKRSDPASRSRPAGPPAVEHPHPLLFASCSSSVA